MNDFQKQIWQNNYKAPEDKTVEDTFLRVAKAVASVQKDKETRQLLTKQYYRIMSQWKFIPGGRILANAGVSERNKATLYNCYVYHPYDFGIKDIDSIQGIFQTLKKSAKILASQGGLGLNLSFIRPNGSYIAGTGVRTPGVIKFMELWDKTSDVITMGSSKTINDKFSSKTKKKIRKGAMLCFSKDTLILTNNGWQTVLTIINKLQNNEQIKCKYIDNLYYTIKNPIINKPSQIYIIQSQDGTRVECTADHKFQVFNIQTGKIYLKALYEIQPETQMLTIINENMEKQYKALVSIKEKGLELSYDFQVQNVHRIIAKSPNSKNAFLTSNCAIDISHPQIKDFITAKQISNHLTKFNLSVLVPDRFMKAMENNEMWKLCFPDIQYENYKQEWDGNLEEWISKGKPIIVYEEIPAKELWDLIMISTFNRNQPGILFYDTINNYNPVGYCQKIITTNPCLSGDTLIAVADGRNAVSIKQLAEKGDDVPVYCIDQRGKLDIQYMRNPRITGYNQDVYKVILDNGSQIKCTGNHKFVLRDGSVKQALELKQNDSLYLMQKIAKPIQQIFKKSNSKSQKYYLLYDNSNRSVFEHRLIYQKMNNVKLNKNQIIHHIDFNSRNNSIQNLIAMTRQQYNKLHTQNMFGNKNPTIRQYKNATQQEKQKYYNNMSKAVGRQKNWKYSEINNQQLYNIILEYVKIINRPITKDIYMKYAKENNLPYWNGKNKYRGSLLHNFLNKANVQCGYLVYVNPAIQRQYYKYIDILQKTDLDIQFDNKSGIILVNKKCQQCGNMFKVKWSQRQICVCSQQCATQYKLNNENMHINGFNNELLNYEVAFINKKNKIDKFFVKYIEQNKQIPTPSIMYEFLQNNCINDFRSIRKVSYQDYINKQYCQKYGIKKITTNGLNQNPIYRKQKAIELLQNGLYYNHKVVSVEYIGKQDVYNGTVDKHHNYNIVCNVQNDNKGICKLQYINTLQCGQIPQPSNVCNLGSLNLVQFFNGKEFDWQEFYEAIKIAVCFLDNVIDISFVPLNEYEQKIKQKRRIGLGVMGLGSLLMMMKLKFGSYEAIQFVDKLFKFKSETQLMTSAVLGKLKGSFLAFDNKKYFSSNWWYELPLNYKTKRQIEEIGQMRNSIHSDNAPTGNCVVKETKIFTEQGIKSIQEIFKENQIILNQNINYWYIPKKQLKVQTLDGYQKITGLYNNKSGKIYSIKTISGKCIIGTQQHKILKDIKCNEVYWIKLSQLKIKDNILIYLNYNYFQKEAIQSIEIYEDFTYDLQVQNSHHYILNNGIISHNSSIFAGQVSNGIQPVYMKQYIRWVVMNNQQKEHLQKRHYCLQYNISEQVQQIPIDVQYQKIPNPQLGQWWQTSIFKFTNRGNQQILRGQIDGITYEIDKNRGLVKPIQVIDYGWKYVKQNIESNNYDWCVTTKELSVEDHINMLSASAKYINQNQSKTINVPENYSYQDFKNIYMDTWKKKIKGITTYRAKTMTVVLQQKKEVEQYQNELEKLFKQANGNVIYDEVTIPNKSYALQYKIKDKNKKKWYFTITFVDKALTKPFAFFIRTNQKESNQVTDLVVQAMESLLLSQGINEKLIYEQKEKYQNQTNVDKIGRSISMALRHNIQITKIVKTLDDYADGLSTLMFHIRKILSSYIKDGTKVQGKICENCGNNQLIFESGCFMCSQCGSSKCS